MKTLSLLAMNKNGKFFLTMQHRTQSRCSTETKISSKTFERHHTFKLKEEQKIAVDKMCSLQDYWIVDVFIKSHSQINIFGTIHELVGNNMGVSNTIWQSCWWIVYDKHRQINKNDWHCVQTPLQIPIFWKTYTAPNSLYFPSFHN